MADNVRGDICSAGTQVFAADQKPFGVAEGNAVLAAFHIKADPGIVRDTAFVRFDRVADEQGRLLLLADMDAPSRTAAARA